MPSAVVMDADETLLEPVIGKGKAGPGRRNRVLVPFEEWKAQPLEKHVDNLRFKASQIASLLADDILSYARRLGKKDTAYIRSQSISFGIMVDKCSQALQPAGIHIALPSSLTEGLQIVIAARVVPLDSSTMQPIDIPSTTQPDIGDRGGDPCDGSAGGQVGHMGPSPQPPA